MSSTKQINQYPAAISIDGSADQLLIDPGGTGTYNKINRNTLLGITSTPIGASDSQTLQNKTLDNTNSVTVKDGSLTVQNTADTTKRAVFSASGITTGTTRTLTLPNRSDTLVTLAGSETLTNKTITSPVITGGTIDNSAITVDSISGHTSATQVTVGGVLMNNGTIGTSGAVVAASILAGAVQPQALTSGTGTSWAWTSFTPSWTNLTTGGGATNSGAYTQTGKTVTGYIFVVLGTSPAVGTGPSFSLSGSSLPPAASVYNNGSANFPLGTGWLNAAGGGYGGFLYFPGANTSIKIGYWNSNVLAGVAASAPGVWANSNIIYCNFTYQAS